MQVAPPGGDLGLKLGNAVKNRHANNPKLEGQDNVSVVLRRVNLSPICATGAERRA
jgi:hypothetical protein